MAKAKAKKKVVKKPVVKKKPEAKIAAAKIKTSPMPTAGAKVTDFEKALDETIEQKPKPQRGGVRPGAGRPAKPEATEPIEAARIQPTEMESAIVELLKLPFDFWSARAKLPGLVLTDDEASMLARPTITLLDYYVPSMPAIVVAWGGLGVSALAIMRPRMILLRQESQGQDDLARSGASPAEPAGGAKGVPPSAPAQSFPKTNQVQPQKIE